MSLSEFYDSQRAYQSSVQQVRDRVDWRPAIQAFSKPSGKVDKSQPIQVDPDLSQKMAAAIVESCSVIAEPINKHMGRLALDAFHRWPIKSGFSKSQIDLQYKTTHTRLEAVVVCRAPYAYMIREKAKQEREARDKRRVRRSLRAKVEIANRRKWVEIAENPARKKDPKIWKAAAMVAARSQGRTTYAGVMVVYRRVKNESKTYIAAYAAGLDLVKRGAPVRIVEREIERRIRKLTKRGKGTKRGKRIADVLLFKPADEIARLIQEDIATNIAKEFG